MITAVKLGQNGCMIVPAEIWHSSGLKDELLLSVGDKRLILETEEALLERLYQTVGDPPVDGSVSEELLRERREEAKQEVADLWAGSTTLRACWLSPFVNPARISLERPSQEGQRSYQELLTRGPDEPPLSYRWKTKTKDGQPVQMQQAYAEEMTRLLLELADVIEGGVADLQAGAPRPRPSFRIVSDV